MVHHQHLKDSKLNPHKKDLQILTPERAVSSDRPLKVL